MLVILVAWFQYRDRLSAWASVPALLQAAFGFFNIWGHQLFTPAFLQAAFGFTISSGHRLYLDVRTYDFYLLSVDGSFGFQPSIRLRQAIEKAHLLWFFTCVYDSLPLGMAVAYVAHLGSKRLLFIPVVLTVAMIGVPLFWILPASGPIFLLATDHFVIDCGSFCSNLAAMTLDKAHLYSSSLVDPKWPRNCLPSLHVTWALLIFWICRDLKWGRWIAGAFLICTALSTMIVSEHYLVDVITVFPTRPDRLAGLCRRRTSWASSSRARYLGRSIGPPALDCYDSHRIRSLLAFAGFTVVRCDPHDRVLAGSSVSAP
jgi:PAP2 superfamily protein